MADEAKGGKGGLKRIPLSAIFSADGPVPPERRAAVVSRVLNEFSGLPVAARNALRSAVNDEIIPTSGGFRRGQAGRALDRSSFLLQEPVVQAVITSDVLAAAVFQCWAESHPSLREAVERHLTGRGLTTPGLNFPERLFHGYWPVHQWEVEQGAFAQTYGEDFASDDVALMLCYVSGNLPIAPEKEGPIGGDEGSLLTALSAALSAMRGLPATSWEWDRQIPDFIASVSRLIDEKAAQLQWTAEFDAILQSLRDQHGELLRFFEQDTLQWAAARVSEDADTATTLKLAEKLQSRLNEYRPIHDMAPGISEERERIQRRAELQPAIIETLQTIDSLMTGDSPVPVTVSLAGDPHAPAPPPDPHTAVSIDHGSEPRSVPQQPAAPESPRPLESEPTQATTLQEAHFSPELAPSSTPSAGATSPGVSAADYTALRSENYGLRDDATALLSQNQGLRDEVEALKTELFSSQEKEDSWRLAYRTAKGVTLEEVEVPSPVVESVHDAVEMARARFRQELVFAPNSESSIEENPFRDPGKVWDALQWLATTYYSSKMGRLRITDFDQSIKEACGWWYKGDQGETTVSRYRDSYTARVDGKRYTLVEHIGKGTTFDSRYTIRIAFNWDRERRQVIIGYIGRHQQTDAS